VAAQNRLQILVNDELRPDYKRIASTMENSQTIRVAPTRGELYLEPPDRPGLLPGGI
jgi:hypothetical protein